MKTIKIFAYALMATSAVMLTSCGDDDSSSAPLPPIGGYNSADEIAAADLIGYWPLNGNGTEAKSGTNFSSSQGVSWVAGPKGQAVNLTNGFMKYPSIAGMTQTLNSFTISAWVKLKNNKVGDVGTASTIFTMARANDWQGNIFLYSETGQRPATSDSIVFKGGFRSSVSGGEIYDNIVKLEPWMIDDNLVTPGKHVANANKVADTWAHAVFTWDGSTNKLLIYSNGVKINNPAFETRGSNTSIVFDTPTYPMIGAFANWETTTDNWNKPMTGAIDEIRVFKKALGQADITALYELEKAGR
ncbi:MAG: LamG-like jellyroll fold domain-containing protein [Flavobacterium sp.]